MIWFRLVDTVVSTSQLLALLSPITDVRDYVNYDNQEKEETQGPSNSYRDYLVIQINSASFRGRIEFGVIRGVNFYLELTPSDRNTRLVNTIGIVESALTSIRLVLLSLAYIVVVFVLFVLSGMRKRSGHDIDFLDVFLFLELLYSVSTYKYTAIT